ncbi:MAG: zf-HC2 domain-containing protein [Coprothermobacterota bacterium]|nr:zf-HC2 domain-containing protein [Coprothermobacterota bacterium]
MRCRIVRPNLESYLAGELPSLHAVDLQRHLDACPACRKEMEVTRRLVKGLRSSFQDAIPPRSLPLPNLTVQPQRLPWLPKVASITVLGLLLLGLIVAPSIQPYRHETPAALMQTSPIPAHQSQSREASEVINRHGTDWRISIN